MTSQIFLLQDFPVDQKLHRRSLSFISPITLTAPGEMSRAFHIHPFRERQAGRLNLF